MPAHDITVHASYVTGIQKDSSEITKKGEKFGYIKKSTYLCSMKGTYLGWEPRLVRQATH